MLEGAKSFFRKNCLKKNSSTVPTAITPLSQVKSAVAFIDVEDTSFDDCKIALQAFYRENNIKGDIFFFDFRKIGKEERLITSITTTVLAKDVNWFGKPNAEKINLMLENEPELFISLIDNSLFPIEFMARHSTAKFKVGRKQLAGNVFDVIVNDPADRTLSELEAFKALWDLLKKVK